jgi:hypothetical protein
VSHWFPEMCSPDWHLWMLPSLNMGSCEWARCLPCPRCLIGQTKLAHESTVVLEEEEEDDNEDDEDDCDNGEGEDLCQQRR